MRNLTREYIIPAGEPISNIRVEDGLCNKEATFTSMELAIVTDSKTGEQSERMVSETFYVGVLTGAVGQYDGMTAYNYLHNGKSMWTFVAPTIGADVTAKYTNKAQSSLDLLMKENKKVLEDLLLASEFVARLEKKNIDCSKYRAEIKALYSRLEDRQDDIRAYATNEAIESPSAKISDALEGIVNDRANLGFVVSTSVIVTAIVVAGFSALAWYVFYTDAGEGRSDCRKSAELNRILAKVDSDTREELYNYIDKYADGFYKRAMARAKWSRLMGNVKTIAIVGAVGYLAYRFLIKRRE